MAGSEKIVEQQSAKKSHRIFSIADVLVDRELVTIPATKPNRQFSMSVTRIAMEGALKKRSVPLLRSHGFKGSFPNFYRDIDGFVSLINFQFYSAGGSLCVNISFADKLRENIYFRPETEPKRLSVSQGRIRARLSNGNLGSDQWFSFGLTSYDEYRGTPTEPDEIAQEINQLIQSFALGWWDQHARGE